MSAVSVNPALHLRLLFAGYPANKSRRCNAGSMLADCLARNRLFQIATKKRQRSGAAEVVLHCPEITAFHVISHRSILILTRGVWSVSTPQPKYIISRGTPLNGTAKIHYPKNCLQFASLRRYQNKGSRIKVKAWTPEHGNFV